MFGKLARERQRRYSPGEGAEEGTEQDMEGRRRHQLLLEIQTKTNLIVELVSSSFHRK